MHSGHLKVQTFPISLSTPKARSIGLAPSEEKPIRVLIIDDHAVIRAALRMFLESQPGITVVGESSGPQDALATAAQEQPNIVLLDLDLGEASGLDLLPDLHVTAPDAHVIVLTGVRDVQMHRQAVRLGAVGLVLKERAPEVLIEAIAKVASGEVWLESLLVASVLSEMTRRPQPNPPLDPETIKMKALTAREREIITLIGQGFKNQTIADRLCISEATVRHHLTSIYGKLAVGDRLELAIYAYRHGLACIAPALHRDMCAEAFRT
jgi:two-component system, NarL family, nitrate/nitrite response regulator NarL